MAALGHGDNDPMLAFRHLLQLIQSAGGLHGFVAVPCSIDYCGSPAIKCRIGLSYVGAVF